LEKKGGEKKSRSFKTRRQNHGGEPHSCGRSYIAKIALGNGRVGCPNVREKAGLNAAKYPLGGQT